MRLDLVILSITLTFVCISFYIRLTTSFWLDETATVWIISRGWLNALLNTGPFPSHPPYYVALSIWQSIFGKSEISLRLPSFLFSLHTALLLSRISQLSIKSHNPLSRTMWTFVGLAMNTAFLDLACQARPYAFGLWLACFSIYTLLRFIITNQTYTLLISGTLSLLACLAHPFFCSLLVINAVIVYLWNYRDYQPKRIRNKATLSLFTVLFAYILLYKAIGIYNTSRVSASYSFMSAHGSISFFQLVENFLYSVRFLFAALLLLLFFSVVRSNLPHKNPSLLVKLFVSQLLDRNVMCIACWIFTPFIVVTFISVLYDVPLAALHKYTYLSVGGFAIALSVLLDNVYRRNNKVVVLISYCILLLGISKSNSFIWAEQWREASNYIKETLDGEQGYVFVWAGHPESLANQHLMNKEHLDAWASPAVSYNLHEVSKVYPISIVDKNKRFSPHVEKALVDSSRLASPVFLLLRGVFQGNESSDFIKPYKKFYESHDYTLNEMKTFKAVTVVYFKNNRHETHRNTEH